jgi:hypothetical protein
MVETFRLYDSILSTYICFWIEDGVLYLWVNILYEHIEGWQFQAFLFIS